MDINQLIEQKTRELSKNNFISFSTSELQRMRPDEAQAVIAQFHGGALMKIPEAEIRFFDWLKTEDPDVWNDLWKDEEDLYLVSIDLLMQFIEGGAGFPICDLVDQPNYWFNARHIKPKGREYLELMIEKLENRISLNLSENFLLQLSTVPTDIWHFSYQHNTRIDDLKKLVEEMVFQGWLVHLTDREDLVRYIDI